MGFVHALETDGLDFVINVDRLAEKMVILLRHMSATPRTLLRFRASVSREMAVYRHIALNVSRLGN